MLRPPFLASQNIKKVALIILNSPINRSSLPLFQAVWNSSDLRYCADGGANRIYNLFDSEERKMFIPDLVIGDLDSLESHVQEYYEKHLVPIVCIKDEYSTDLNKAVSSIGTYPPREAVNDRFSENLSDYDVMVFGGVSGRLDQTIHTLVFLHQYRTKFPNTRIWIVGEDCVSCALGPGETEIDVSSKYLGPTCGILPVGVDSAMLTTKGLRWNLDNAVTSFNGLVSTSNHLAGDKVAVTTDKSLVWTCELRYVPS